VGGYKFGIDHAGTLFLTQNAEGIISYTGHRGQENRIGDL